MSKDYFNSLNYTIGNEDTSLELAVMPENTQHVFAIAGSGSRIIPLLSKNPLRLTCVDSSFEQLALAELRIASVKLLDYEDFLSFWGYPPRQMSSRKRQQIFNNLEISEQAKIFLETLFKKHGWQPILYSGKWEQTFKKLSKINRLLVGQRGLGIFSCQTREEQENYLKIKFPHRAWSFSIFILGNAVVFNALLYKGNFPQRNIKKSLHGFYMERFGRLFKQDIARKNYFLQLLFFGSLQYPDGLPVECDQNVFLKAKNGLQKTKVDYICGDILEEAKNPSLPIDFLSLSDVPSYLKRPREQMFLQEIKNGLSARGIVVCRYYLRIPENLNVSGYKNITDNFREAIAREKIQMYSFGIFQKN
jgi:S-adenosylmethionine-diacylglycerol 3-amino-3-carboxypropyl transferase